MLQNVTVHCKIFFLCCTLVTLSLLLAVWVQAGSFRHDSPSLESTLKMPDLPLPQQMAGNAILVEDLSLILTSCLI